METFLRNIQTNSLRQSVKRDSNSSALIAIKVSIERILVDSRDKRDKLLQLLKTFTYFDEKNLSTELIVACAEAYQSDFEMVGFCYMGIFCHTVSILSHRVSFVSVCGAIIDSSICILAGDYNV